MFVACLPAATYRKEPIKNRWIHWIPKVFLLMKPCHVHQKLNLWESNKDFVFARTGANSNLWDVLEGLGIMACLNIRGPQKPLDSH